MQSMIYPILGNEKLLPFYLTGIGVSRPEYRVCRESGLISHQFLMTLQGSGVLNIDGKSIPQKQGSIFYLSPSVPHEYLPVSDYWETAWIVFRGDGLSEAMKKIGFSDWASKDNIDIDALKKIFDRIYAAAEDSASGAVRASLLIYEFILAAKKAFDGDDEKVGAGALAGGAVAYIDQNYANDISLEILAHNAGVSPQHLCRVFKTKVGMRPMEYLARRRVAAAKQLLFETNKSIAEIAAEVGYSGLTYFGMVFRKYEGITPSDYRTGGGISCI